MSLKHILWICLLILPLAACVAPSKPSLTPLEIQALQTREYEESVDTVFASTISVFQDLGFIVKSADKLSGFITAEGTAKSETAASWFFLVLPNVKQTHATAFIERIGKLTKVRLNFVVTSERSIGWGMTERNDTPVLDSEVYQNAFERIENAIFIRSNS
ncbi:MAG: hypothetical protein OEY09_12865 [Gammaproteobacteria bacterium]|nr:hypothetical protein [Gammaproteobacteria bacterium]